MKKIYEKSIALIALILALCLYPLAANSVSYKENEVKVAFLFRSLQYINWDNILGDNKSPITICSYSKPALTSLLKTLHDRTVDDRKIVVATKQKLFDPEKCNVAYIQAESQVNFKFIITKFENKQVLTVNDNPEFSHLGSVLNFITRDQRISIEVNLKKARQANIVFSAKYLRIANIIDNGN